MRLALFEDRIGGRLIEVRDPSLTFAEMEEGRQALVMRLNELENPEPPEEVAETTEESGGAPARAGAHGQVEKAEIPSE
jgi:hypothetical protein